MGGRDPGEEPGAVDGEDRALDDNDEDENPTDNRFKEFKHLFDNLTVQAPMDTGGLGVLDVLINARSTHILALCKGDDDFF